MKDSELRKATKVFAQDWMGHGDEKQETQYFWKAFLSKLFGVKTIIVVLAALLLVLVAVPVNAEDGTSLYFSELDMKVVVPSGFDVFTRDTSANDPNLKKYGITSDQLVSTMKSQNSYLDAMGSDGYTELTITMFKSDWSDFNLLSDTALKTLFSSIKDEYSKMGLSVSKYDIYSHTQAKFIRMYASRSVTGGKVYTLQYTTVYSGKTINFTLQSYSGTAISASQESTIKKLVDSAQFGSAPATTSIPKSTEAFVYSDKAGKVHLTVPANWREEPLSKEREIIKAKFVTDQEPGLSMLYGYYDIWSAMSTAEKAGQTRSSINMSAFSRSDIAEAFGIPESKVKSVTYNGQQYYQAEVVSESMGLSVETTILYHIDNGYMYQFQFFGTPSDKYFKDFESLVRSVVYEAATTIKPTATTKPAATAKKTTSEPPSAVSQQASSSGNGQKTKATINSDSIKWGSILGIVLWSLLPGFIANKKGRSFLAYFMLSFVLTPLITTIITLCLSNKNKVKNYNPEIKNESLRSDTVNDAKKQDMVEEAESSTSSSAQDTILDLFAKGLNEATEKVQAMKPTLTSNQFVWEPNYGFDDSNPVLVESLQGTTDYLHRLCTTDGNTFTWSTYTSVRAEVHGIPDVGEDQYTLYLNGQPYGDVYFVLYVGKSEFPPAGLSFVDDRRNWVEERLAAKCAHEMGVDRETAKQIIEAEAKQKEKDTLSVDSNTVDLNQPEETNESQILPTSSETDNNSEAPAVELLYCRYCGFKLLTDSEYCSHCGKKVR